MYKVQVFVAHGYFEYEVGSMDRAMAHAQAIMTTRVYRRVTKSEDVEFHQVFKVKVKGDDLGSEYSDTFKRT